MLLPLAAMALAGSGTAAVTAAGQRIPNPHFTYPGFELWDPANWPESDARIAPLLQWIAARQPVRADYRIPASFRNIPDFVGHPDYNWKSESVADRDVIAPLERLGLRVDIREGGGFFIVVAPQRVLANSARRAPILIVPTVVEKRDVFWAMNTLNRFRSYNELAAKRSDFIIVYLLTERSQRPGGIAANIIDTTGDGYRGDSHKIFLDVSTLAQARARLADVPTFDWPDDKAITHLGTIPVLDVTGQWTGKPAPGVHFARPRGDVRYEPQRVVRGMLGERVIEGAKFVHIHGKDSDPAVRAEFEKMGLVFREHDHQGERWLMFSPRHAVEKGIKLPLVLILSEANHYQEYAATSTYAQYRDYFRLAAQGELNILVFARETPEAMDRAAAVIAEAEKAYPVDPARIYVTGHSHNGHLAREFAYRHPRLVAAVAALGNSSGLAAPLYSHEAVVADDRRIAAWSKIDMPIITIGAASEVTSPHSMPSSILNDYDAFIESWQRRLTASRSPMRSRQEIIAAEHSDDPVTRLFGLPNDGSALEVIEGVEHYIIDIRNTDGRKHLRIVGIDNMVHSTVPTMPMLSWTFMRRFARDRATGKVIDLP